MMRPTLPNFLCRAAALAAILAFYQPVQAGAQEPPPPQGVSRGENFSAKPPAQLFASDCTGAGCHKGPQGLGRKGLGIGGLAGFLREHYTNSRESAAALANYLSGQPSGPAPKPNEKPKPGAKPAATASAPSGLPNWFESTTESRPAPGEHKPREATPTPPNRNPQTASKPEPAAKPEAKPDGIMKEDAERSANEPAESAEKPGESASKPAEPPNRRAQRGRQPAATAANASAPAAAAPAAEPEPAHAPAAASPPAPKQYDIFD